MITLEITRLIMSLKSLITLRNALVESRAHPSPNVNASTSAVITFIIAGILILKYGVRDASSAIAELTCEEISEGKRLSLTK